MISMGVVLLPIPEILEELIACQQEVACIQDLQPALGLETNIAHLTLLQGKSERELLGPAELSEVAEEFCRLVPTCSVTVSAFEYVAQGWYFLQIEEVATLRTLQSKVMSICSERLRVTEQDLRRDLSVYSPTERENYRQFGYRYLGTDYRPHITLGRTPNLQPSARVEEFVGIVEPVWVGRSIPIEELCLVVVGEHGSYKERILSIPI